NPTPGAITISNWCVKDAQPGQFDSLPEITIDPGQFVVVAANTNYFLVNNPGYSNLLYEIIDPNSNGIGNGLNYYMDGLALCDPASNIIDAASYGLSTAFLNPPMLVVATNGHSMARQPANRDTHTRNDWVDRATPDPGAGVIESGINQGDSVEIVFQLEMPCSVSPGTLKSTATFSQPPGSALSTNSLNLLLNPKTAALVVRKTPILQSRKYQEEFTWDVTVRNEGLGRAPNVRIVDSAGPGIEFRGFSVPPTNGAIGFQVAWDQTVIPALSNMAPGDEVSVTVTARADFCFGLYNDADASWACGGFVAATNSVCGDTAASEGTARATIDFITEQPLLSGQISPAAPIAVSYCNGTEVTLVITNPINGGPARNIELLPYIPAGFAMTGTSVTVSNTIVVGDLDPNSTTSVVVTLKPTSCPVPTEIQNFFIQSRYEDLCGNRYSALTLSGSFQADGEPGASIYKIIPTAIYGSQPTTTVSVLFFYSNFNSTAVTVIDTYPRDPSNILSVANVTPPAADDGTNLTWTLSLSGSGVYTARFDLVVSSDTNAQCHAPDSLMANILTVPDFTNCLGCTRPVLGSGRSYPVSFYPSGCGGTGGCSYGSAKAASASLVEGCAPIANTHQFTFSGNVPSNGWDGAQFTSDLGGGTVDTNQVFVYADNSNVTAYLSFIQTSPNLILGLDGLTNSAYSAPSLITNALTVIWSAAHTNIGLVSDYSWLTLGPCGGRGARTYWMQGESLAGVALTPITNNNACGVSTIKATLSNLQSPGIPGEAQNAFPLYDVQLIVDLDADGDTLYSYDYVPGSAVFSNMLDSGGAPIPSFDPSIQTNLLVWDLSDLASNGAGVVYFNIRGSCESFASEKHTARLVYNTRCTEGDSPRARRASSATNGLPPLFSGSLQLALQPEYSFLTSTQYTTRIEIFNAGAGAAYNIGVELANPSNLVYGTADVAPTNVTTTNMLWGGFSTNNPLGDLKDLDGDGQADDLLPNGTFSIHVTNYVKYCAENTISARTHHGCKDTYCQITDMEQAEFITAAGQIVTHLDFPVNLVVCSNSTADYVVRNAGLVDLINVHAQLVLPTGITYMAGSSRYVFQGITNLVVGDPSGSGSLVDPLTWDDVLIPPLSTLQPTQMVTILFDFPIACESTFSDGQFGLLTEYTDICGRTNLTQQVRFTATLRKPDLAIVMEAGTNGASFSGGQMVRDPGDPIVYRVRLSHTVNSEASVPSLFMTAALPTNVAFVSASPAPVSQTGTNGAILTWDTAALTALIGGPPFEVGDPAIEVFVTGLVVGCAADISGSVTVDYGCSDLNQCLTVNASHSLRTAPFFPNLSSYMDMVLNTCGGPKTLVVTNLGSTAESIVLHEKAPAGYLFAAASITGEFYAANAILSLTGTPVGTEAILDLTTTNSSGAIDAHNSHGDTNTLDLGFEAWFKV
ncbi:MAG: hypothetical protein V2A34_07580, partial [Lentisphaerota bacterium]